MYLNTQYGFERFQERYRSKVFIDKSMILQLLNERIGTDDKYICVTRPRRFGKSQITFLLESYYSIVVDSKPLFDNLLISSTVDYEQHLNHYNVIKCNSLIYRIVKFQHFVETEYAKQDKPPEKHNIFPGD